MSDKKSFHIGSRHGLYKLRKRAEELGLGLEKFSLLAEDRPMVIFVHPEKIIALQWYAPLPDRPLLWERVPPAHQVKLERNRKRFHSCDCPGETQSADMATTRVVDIDFELPEHGLTRRLWLQRICRNCQRAVLDTLVFCREGATGEKTLKAAAQSFLTHEFTDAPAQRLEKIIQSYWDAHQHPPTQSLLAAIRPGPSPFPWL